MGAFNPKAARKRPPAPVDLNGETAYVRALSAGELVAIWPDLNTLHDLQSGVAGAADGADVRLVAALLTDPAGNARYSVEDCENIDGPDQMKIIIAGIEHNKLFEDDEHARKKK